MFFVLFFSLFKKKIIIQNWSQSAWNKEGTRGERNDKNALEGKSNGDMMHINKHATWFDDPIGLPFLTRWLTVTLFSFLTTNSHYTAQGYSRPTKIYTQQMTSLSFPFPYLTRLDHPIPTRLFKFIKYVRSFNYSNMKQYEIFNMNSSIPVWA